MTRQISTPFFVPLSTAITHWIERASMREGSD